MMKGANSFRHIAVVATLIFTTTLSAISHVEGASVPCDLQDSTPDGVLSFVRDEWTNKDIVVLNRELLLECDASNFCGQMEWYNNHTGKPIEKEPGFIEFEDQKQKLVLMQARLSDGIYYTCRASNGQDSITRTILVQILDEIAGDLVPVTHEDSECRNQTADLGGSVTFFCEYSVGTSKAKNSLGTYWSKNTSTGLVNVMWLKWDFPNDTAVYEEIKSGTTEYGENRNGYWIYNTTLHVRNISEESLTYYRVQYQDEAGNPFDQYLSITLREEEVIPVDRTKGLSTLFIILGLLSLPIALIGVGVYKYRLELKLFRKDHFSKECAKDNKESDVYISYFEDSEDDLKFVIVLKEDLEKSGYRVIVRDIDFLLGTCKYDEIVESLKTCRRCILVISPGYITSSTSLANYDLSVTMDRMDNYKHQIIPIMHQDISKMCETNEKKLLTHIIENVKCLTWPDQGSAEGERSQGQNSKRLARKKKIFHKELLLRMPPRCLRKASPVYNTSPSQVELISYENQVSQILPTIPEGVSSLYPDPHSATYKNETFSVDCTDPHYAASESTMATNVVEGTKTRMYPVLT